MKESLLTFSGSDRKSKKKPSSEQADFLRTKEVASPDIPEEILRKWFSECDGLRPQFVTRRKFDNSQNIVDEENGVCLLPENSSLKDLERVTSALRESAFRGREEIGEKDEKAINERKDFLARTGKYLNNLSEKIENPERKEFMENLANFFNTVSGDREVEDLTKEQKKAIEKFLTGGKDIYQRYRDEGGDKKVEVSEKYVKTLQNAVKRKERGTSAKAKELIYSHQHKLSQLNILKNDFVRMIYERGNNVLMNELSIERIIEGLENLLKEEPTDSRRERVIESKPFWQKMKNKFVQLEELANATIENSNLSILEKVKVIVNSLSFIGYRSDNIGSPVDSFKNGLVQCVSVTALGKYLEKIEGVSYLPVSMEAHMAALVKIDKDIHFIDATTGNMRKIEQADIETELNHNRYSLEKLTDYVSGKKKGDDFIYFPKDFWHEMGYDRLTRHRIVFLQNNQTVLSSSLLYNLGTFFDDKNNYKKAEQFFLLSSSQGNPDALSRLGNLYSKEGTKLYDPKKAEKNYLLSIKHGNFSDYFNLGGLYSKMDTDLYDLEKAEKYYKLSEEQGGVAALFYLGKLYGKKETKLYDPTKAIEYYNKFIKNWWGDNKFIDYAKENLVDLKNLNDVRMKNK